MDTQACPCTQAGAATFTRVMRDGPNTAARAGCRDRAPTPGVTPVTTPEGSRYQLEGVAEVGRLLALDSDAKGASPVGHSEPPAV
jgi:hypothetical protein